MNKIVLLLMVITCASCASTKPIIRNSVQEFSPKNIHNKNTICHYVKKGDSLWKISKLYSTSIARLMKENKIASPNDLKIGQIIYIAKHQVVDNKKTFIFPVNGEIVSFFGESKKNLANNGIDISLNTNNKNVLAVSDGKVVFARSLKGWGNAIILKHNYNLYTIYANITDTLVKENAYAKKGELIGQLVANGNKQCVLHFEIRKNHIPQNPLKYFNN